MSDPDFGKLCTKIGVAAAIRYCARYLTAIFGEVLADHIGQINAILLLYICQDYRLFRFELIQSKSCHDFSRERVDKTTPENVISYVGNPHARGGRCQEWDLCGLRERCSFHRGGRGQIAENRDYFVLGYELSRNRGSFPGFRSIVFNDQLDWLPEHAAGRVDVFLGELSTLYTRDSKRRERPCKTRDRADLNLSQGGVNRESEQC